MGEDLLCIDKIKNKLIMKKEKNLKKSVTLKNKTLKQSINN